jgi:hypothetical protein
VKIFGLIIISFILGLCVSFFLFTGEKSLMVKIENDFHPVDLRKIKQIEINRDYSVSIKYYSKNDLTIKNDDPIRELIFENSKTFLNIESIDPKEKTISSSAVAIYLKGHSKIQKLNDLQVFLKEDPSRILGDYKISKDGLSLDFCPKQPYIDGEYKVLIKKLCFENKQCIDNLSFNFNVSSMKQSNPFEVKCEF